MRKEYLPENAGGLSVKKEESICLSKAKGRRHEDVRMV